MWKRKDSCTYERQYGPIKATVTKHWSISSSHGNGWYCIMTVGHMEVCSVFMDETKIPPTMSLENSIPFMLGWMHNRVIESIQSWAE